MTKKYFVFATAVAMLVAADDASATTITRVADTVGDAQLFNTGSQDRAEMIVGKTSAASGVRRGLVRFDTSAYSDLIGDPLATLTGAKLILHEQSGRNGNNAALQGEIGAYLLTQASGDWVVPGEHIAGEVWGATWANRRTDRFNKDAFARNDPGNNTVDGDGRMRFASVGAARGTTNPNNGPAFGSTDQPDVKYSTSESAGANNTINSDQFAGSTVHTFDAGDENEVVMIDLLSNGNVSIGQLTDTLSEWITGNNAGVVLAADSFSTQIFFQSSDGDNDGDGTSWALDTYTGGSLGQTVTTESGNGAGGTLLELTFEVVPEPSTFLLTGAAFVVMLSGRRRK